MKINVQFFLGLSLVLFSSMLNAEPSSWYSGAPNHSITLNVDFFLSSTCPHCHKAEDFLKSLEAKGAPLKVKRYVINEDKSALELFHHKIQESDSLNFAVPSIFFCDSRWVGYIDEQQTGQLIVRAMDYCYNQIMKQGELTPGTVKVLRQWSMANQVRVDNKIVNSPSRFLIVTALTDAFGPCSFFVFVTFLSFLWVTPKRWKLELSYGLLFLVTLGYVHYIEQAHSTFFYQSSYWARLPALILGLLLILFFSYYLRNRFGRVYKQVYALPYLIILTVPLVMVFQQTCNFNIAILVEQWATVRGLSSSAYFWYHFLYHLVYLSPLFVFLILHLLGNYYFRLATYSKIQMYSGALMLWLIGLILVVWPWLLSNILASLVVLMVAIGLGWYLGAPDERKRNL